MSYICESLFSVHTSQLTSLILSPTSSYLSQLTLPLHNPPLLPLLPPKSLSPNPFQQQYDIVAALQYVPATHTTY